MDDDLMDSIEALGDAARALVIREIGSGVPAGISLTLDLETGDWTASVVSGSTEVLCGDAEDDPSGAVHALATELDVDLGDL